MLFPRLEQWMEIHSHKSEEILTPEEVQKKVFHFVRIERSLSIKDALNAPILKKVYKASPYPTIAVVIAIIGQYASQLNINKTLTADQMTIMATDLIEYFECDTLEDIVLLFKYARQGKFDSSFDARSKFDIKVVTKWLPQYMDIKAQERERMIADREGRAAKEREEAARDMHPEAKKRLAEMRKARSMIKVKRKGSIPNDSTLNDSDLYLEQLKANIGKLTSKQLTDLFKTSKFTNKEVFEIVDQERKKRKEYVKK